MTSVIFTFTLSALLGYLLFAGSSRYLNKSTRKRPAGLQALSAKQISLFIGITTAFMAFFTLRWLMQSTPADLTRLSALFLLICPSLCIVAFFEYQHRRKCMMPAQPAKAIGPLALENLTQKQADETHTTTPYPLTEVAESGNNTESATESRITIVESDSVITEINESPEMSAQPCHMMSHSEDPASLPSDRESGMTLSNESTLREDTEKHLRITRKALSVLEAESKQTKEFYTRLLTEIKGKLARSVKESKALKAHVSNERARTLKALNTIARLKKKQVQFKQQIHKSTAARAKALSTANKTIGFARQSLQIRARLESELNEMRLTRKGQEKTINDLSRSLEREKRINQAEVEAMAKQLILREKRASAKLARAQVVRGVENNLSTRLVRKVAKARAPSADQSER